MFIDCPHSRMVTAYVTGALPSGLFARCWLDDWQLETPLKDCQSQLARMYLKEQARLYPVEFINKY